jgi:hypothetical protein
MHSENMTSTRYGSVLWHYSREVEPRPFSRFTADDAEQQANDEWIERALRWGETRFDAYANRIA